MMNVMFGMICSPAQAAAETGPCTGRHWQCKGITASMTGCRQQHPAVTRSISHVLHRHLLQASGASLQWCYSYRALCCSNCRLLAQQRPHTCSDMRGYW
jgi:hypothetical protein